MTIANNPFEVMGLERLVEPQEADYIGKAALERIRVEGVSRKLVGIEAPGDALPFELAEKRPGAPSRRVRRHGHRPHLEPAAREEHRLRLAADRARRPGHGARDRRAERRALARPQRGHPVPRREEAGAAREVARAARPAARRAPRRRPGRRCGTRRAATRSGGSARPRRRSIVEIALISGVTPNRIELQISTGSVVEPTPALNDVITRSSNDRAKASIAPAAIAGASSGTVTCRNAPNADAPRSRAASSSCGLRFAARARTVIATYEMQNVMCASEICPIEPVDPNTWKKNTRRLMPTMISGVIIGSRSRVWTAPEPRNRSRASPRPSSEPRIVEPTTAIAATCERDPERVHDVLVAEQRRVPVEREPAPDERPLGVVEAEDDQDDDRREQEEVDQRRERGQPARWPVATSPRPPFR